jgi:guanine deaminase
MAGAAAGRRRPVHADPRGREPAEVRWVAELFPQARSYLDVYERHGLLNERAVLAHGIWLDDADRALLRARRADRLLPQLQPVPGQRPVRLGRGRSRRRGRQPGATSAAAPACRCSARWPTPTRCRRWPAPSSAPGRCCMPPRAAPRRRWAWATRSAARRRCDGRPVPVGLGHGPVARRRQQVARDLHEKVFAWITLADERNLVETWVAGVRRHRRDGAS